MYKKSLFIFRRSLRLDDNTGLIHALQLSKKVIPIFICTPEQLVKNSFKSNNAVQFMCEALQDLDTQLHKKKSRLFYFFGEPNKIIQKLINNQKIDAIFVNQDYTPYSKKRDEKIKKVCKKYNIDFNIYEDILLHNIGSVMTTSGSLYQKFTPYYRKCSTKKIAQPKKNNYKNYIAKSFKIVGEYKKELSQFYTKNNEACVHGGTQKALKIIKHIKKYKNYDKKRNNLTYQTTRLSAYLKFGCISIRQIFYAIRSIRSKELMRQLYWRDFYYNIAYFFPYVFSGPMKKKYASIRWKQNKKLFNAWKQGKTGFPIIDACMRELNITGYMHNRGRLITSNFLIKILFINWQKGEKYFAQKLIDYDPCVNNGNWQWSASCGADSQPYFRIFNPWIQSKKFDPTSEYIKKWIPELKDVKTTDIHKWDVSYKKYKNIKYPSPIVNYKKQRQKTLNNFYQDVFT